jgi:hypothetical protein
MMQTASYKVVPVSAAGCEGDTIDVTLYVKPAPVLSVMGDTVCSGEAAAIMLSETTGMSGVSFTWDAYEALPISVYGLNGAPSSGPGSMITDQYVNFSGSDVVIPYEVTPTSMGRCTGELDTAYLTVQTVQNNVQPVFLSACEDVPGSGQATFDLTSLDAGIGSNVMWYNDNGPIANPAAYVSGLGAAIGFSSDNCGTSQAVVLTVEQTPVMPNVDMVVGACNGSDALIEPATPAPSVFFAESFEGPGIGWDVTADFYASSSDYFTRTDDNTVNPISAGFYSGIDGDFFWAAEDINSFPDIPGVIPRYLTLLPIPITGKSDLRFDGLFAASTSNQFDASDYVQVEYRIDGSAWKVGLAFRNTTGGSNARLAEDTDFNGLGDGTLLDRTLTNYGFDIVGTGNFLEVRVAVALNSGSEEAAFDNLRVSGASSGALYNFYADAALTQPLATGATSYSATAPDTVWVTTISGNCESMAKRVIVEPRTAASITAVGDTVVFEGADCLLNVASGTTGFADYAWTGPNGFTATGAAASRTNLTPADSGWYVLQATDLATGCTSYDSVLVEVVRLNNAGVPVNDTICVLIGAPMFNMRDSLIDSEPGGVWAGPSALMNGDMGTFDPATMSSGYYT